MSFFGFKGKLHQVSKHTVMSAWHQWAHLLLNIYIYLFTSNYDCTSYLAQLYMYMCTWWDYPDWDGINKMKYLIWISIIFSICAVTSICYSYTQMTVFDYTWVWHIWSTSHIILNIIIQCACVWVLAGVCVGITFKNPNLELIQS